MKKVAVVGPYGVGPDFTTGQAVKCFEIVNWLKDKYDAENVYIVNTYKWKKNPLKLFFRMIMAFKECKNVIMMPAENGAKVFLPMAYRLKHIYNRQVHYIVIGGWLKEMLDNSKLLRKAAESFDGLYVETKSMVDKLDSIGLKHNFFMPNCRQLSILNVKKPNEWKEPIPVCTYSRVTEEKGISDAVEIIKIANGNMGRKVFTLDVYGKVASEYQKAFEQLIADNKDIVRYCGVKNSDEGAATLAPYFALLFPTYYFGEGFAGTILDAFASNTPVIANDWKYNSEIISSGKNGFIYPYRNNGVAAAQLCCLYQDNKLYASISQECGKCAQMYSTDNVMQGFSERLS